MVALARALAADPQWPAKARDGRAGEIVPCLRCLQCYHISTDRWNVGCSVNPRFANETFVPCRVEPASVKKKVLVVGAGPAGVMAAATAHARGHEVVLAERDETVGGAVRLIAREHHKEDAARYLRYMRHEVEELARLPRFELRLGLEVSPKTVRELAPDALIVAVGADPLEPPIPGIDGPGVVPFAQAITHVDELGKNVVIVGGGTIGAELALELAETDRRVRVIEMGDRIAAQGNSLFRIALRQMFEKQGDRIEVILGTACVSIEKGGVRVKTPEGEERVLACDDVVTALGVRPRSGLVEALSDVAPQTLVVGDCRRARVIKDAVFEGYMAAAGI